MDFSAVFKFRQAALYGFIGLSAVVIDYGVFFVLHNFFDWQFLAATATSVFMSSGYAFTLNAHFNFRKTDQIFMRFLSYFSVSGIGLLISMATLAFFSGYLGFNPNIVKAASIPFIVALQYMLNVLVSFSHTLFEKRVTLGDVVAHR